MDDTRYPIPRRLNLALAVLQGTVLLGLLWGAGQVESGWAVATLVAGLWHHYEFGLCYAA